MHMARRTARLGLLVIVGALASGCGINNIPTYDEGVKAAWGQVQNQYQRRADLVPNLVATVQGYAAHERETLQAVIEAFVTREGTDDGPQDVSLATKVWQVRQQLDAGTAVIVYDESTESCSIQPADQLSDPL